MRSVVKLLFFSALLPFLASAAETSLPPEAHPRNGLPHLAAKLTSASSPSAEIRVAFLGGSITAANGWRSGILTHLRAAYPRHHFTEIFAALPGTGSDLGAARLRDDVLRHAPDLLFVEFAVNDTGRDPAAIRRSIEGIVRQTRLRSPSTDLCFVYTLSHAGLPDLEAGRFPPPAAAMEEVAAHYGIPTHHFGVEIVRQLRAGKLVFSGAAPAPAIPVFATDQIHPGTAGHRLYTESLARQLPAFLAVNADAVANASPALPAPLQPGNWEGARIVSLFPLGDPYAGEWEAIPTDDPRLAGIPREFRRQPFTATKPGTVLEFTFTGTAFGLYGIKGPDAGRFRVTIDDRAPVVATLFDTHCTAGRYRVKPWFYPTELPAGSHTVRVEILPDGPDKAAARAAGKEEDPAFDLHALTLSGVILVQQMSTPGNQTRGSGPPAISGPDR